MRFYVLEEDTLSRQCATDVHGISKQQGDAPKCPKCGGIFGMLQWLPPYTVEIVRRGRQFGDIIYAMGGNMIVTEAFREAWVHSKLKGLNAFDPVDIIRVKPKKAAAFVPIYWHIVTETISTAIDLHRSDIIWSRPISCDYCLGADPDAIAGFTIDESTWTGEDIFRSRHLTGTTIVTEPFADMVQQYKLSHAVLIPTEKYIFDPLHLIVPYTESKA